MSRTALDERLPLDVAVMALAHTISDKIEATQRGVNQPPTISIQQLSAHRYLRIPSLHRADYCGMAETIRIESSYYCIRTFWRATD